MCVCVCVCVCVTVHMLLRLQTYVCVCMSVRACVCLEGCEEMHGCAYVHASGYVCVCVCVCVCENVCFCSYPSDHVVYQEPLKECVCDSETKGKSNASTDAAFTCLRSSQTPPPPPGLASRDNDVALGGVTLGFIVDGAAVPDDAAVTLRRDPRVERQPNRVVSTHRWCWPQRLEMEVRVCVRVWVRVWVRICGFVCGCVCVWVCVRVW